MKSITGGFLGSIASVALLGCASVSGSSDSISDSVRGSSNSISGSLESMSDSSSSDEHAAESEKESYREDVRLATRSFVTSGESDLAFLRELGQIAERHGINDWESRPETLIGIGSGARQAGLAAGDLDALLSRLGQDDAGRRALAREGFEAASLRPGRMR